MEDIHLAKYALEKISGNIIKRIKNLYGKPSVFIEAKTEMLSMLI